MTGAGQAAAPVLPYPHARNDCGVCREHDADVQVLTIGAEDHSPPGRLPSLVCQGCLGMHLALAAMRLSGPKLDEAVTVTITVAPGRRP